MRFVAATEPALRVQADWLVAGVYGTESAPLPEGAVGFVLHEWLDQFRIGKDFEGKPNELLPMYGMSGMAAERILLVGLGEPKKLTRRILSRAYSAAARHIAAKQRGKVAVVLPPLPETTDPPMDLVAATAEVVAAMLAGSRGQDDRKTEKTRRPFEETAIVCLPPFQADTEAGIARGLLIGEAINRTRELVNLPPADLYPQSFCDRAVAWAAEAGIEATVLDDEELKRQGMNCILGVGQGSARPPRLLVLRYRGAQKEDRRLALVGKGITFDSGGLCIKPADSMEHMKCDMAGAATVVAATIAIAKLKLPIDLICLTPLAENMTGSNAFRPGDILAAKNGKTIEIVNTDAEGRLVLADALCHAVDLGATHIVDLATLTGACIVALGNDVAGLMTNAQSWCDQVANAARHAGELVWQLPMYDEYDDLIKSEVADMKNAGPRGGGAITAAKLLVKFVGAAAWTHVDIAGPSYATKDAAHQDGGGTGYFVRTLIDLAEHFA